ncbi:MAG: Sec-independent protein translocase subunit TatA [Actinobacteria bacterium]|nr:Sec-independent protein translocase subunit TatA [Actinomycetota bacterium]
MFYLQPALYLNQTQSLLILALVAIILFGAKRLPDSARALGRSLRIFKSEVKELSKDDKKVDDDGKSAS